MAKSEKEFFKKKQPLSLNLTTIAIASIIMIVLIVGQYSIGGPIDRLEDRSLDYFILVPILSILVLFFRQFIGIETFGLFGPIVIASTLILYGIGAGVVLYVGLLFLGILTNSFLKRAKFSSAARLSLTLYALAILGVIIYYFFGQGELFAFFELPFLITAHLIERFNKVKETYNLVRSIDLLFHTFFVAVVSGFIGYLILIFLDTQETIILLFVTAILAVVISMYNGLRVSEIFRFKEVEND